MAPNPESAEGKLRMKWEEKNDEAFSIIVTTLSEEQAGQFLTETNAKKIWITLRGLHEGDTQGGRIDIGLELKNIRMNASESVIDYITRARNIASRSAAIGYPI